ncbi:DUF4857 domain-containing protein [Salidesulfovibrio brasiliensis]|uniref:DUF4857 domain-containing protein n=1 Tax=Salidesulfovibrio brasiliensis TaxID=221711 RepID=UPI0006CFFD32|nr:DUF4857 domain-containing protein [Salidesulfovibrio brasiliensis]
MTRLSRYALVLAAIVVMAVYAPLLFDMAFGERVKTTHLFYSPVIKKFVWRDKLLEMPDGATEHHARYVQMDEDGNRYTRQEFEKLLPFIYYRNMELWGLLPLELNGQNFDRETIKARRQVSEFKPEQIAGRSPQEQLLPLIESVPGNARLVFPEQRFRLGDELEFINADFNRRDPELTKTYTKALKRKGFVFPGRMAFSKPTILKPFDEGAFLVDAEGSVFHLKRVEGRPKAVKTPISPKSGVRSIRVSENTRQEYYGLLLANDDTLHLIGYDGYKLTPLPLEHYDPDTMDFKMIVNPLYRTAVYSDDEIVRAVVMDPNYRPLARYEHVMPGAGKTFAERVFNTVTPFGLKLKDGTSGYLSPGFVFHGPSGFISIGLALTTYLVIARRKGHTTARTCADGGLVALTGMYGLVAVLLLPAD